MRQVRRERGQILPIVAVALVGLLGVAAFSIDVGYAYFAKRQLQSAVDAAALAGAQDLPSTTSQVTAASYGLANHPANLPAFVFTYQLKCTATAILATGCNPAVNPNELYVDGTTTTDTWFAGLFGVKHFTMSAHANACSPCSSTPVDIMIAIDRTGSMCINASNKHDCGDMNNAKDGVQTMLKILNPPSAQVGMVAFPPVQTTATSVCDPPYNTNDDGWNGYDAAGRGYLTDALNGNYRLDTGALNTGSGLIKHTTDGDYDSCVQSAGSTSYTEALRQTQAELVKDGRVNVPDYIVFLTDGEANMGSVYPRVNGKADATYPPGNLDDQRPCQSAVDLATTIKAKGVTIYSIGYALGTATPCTAGQWHKAAVVNGRNTFIDCTPQVTTGCEHYQGNKDSSSDLEAFDKGKVQRTSFNTLDDIASDGDFYNKVDPGQLDTIFAAIATDIAQGSSRLVDDSF